MTKQQRLEVYNKYNGHCAYCGKEITLKNMQVDHTEPVIRFRGKMERPELDVADNQLPACRRCNNYKYSMGLEEYRRFIKTLHGRVLSDTKGKVAQDYGIMTVKEWDGLFYFERVSDNG